MQVLEKITDQLSSVDLPLYAVTLTAIPRRDTPFLLMLHWHGFRREPGPPPQAATLHPVPGSALQLNERWESLASVETAMLDAAWALGAWDVERMEKRACNDIGASEREAMECRQAFGEHPLLDAEKIWITEAPDRTELMQLGARVGYVRWQFRPVRGGVWRTLGTERIDDATLTAEGGREPPCPVVPQISRGGRATRTVYRLGRSRQLIILP